MYGAGFFARVRSEMDHQSKHKTFVALRSTAWAITVEVAKVLLAPALILLTIVFGIVLLGLAQRLKWIKPTTPSNASTRSLPQDAAQSWICPMMCVPPTNKSGRCPVCAMELVVASRSATSAPSTKIAIDPRSRRVAGIQTTVAKRLALEREIHSVGEITYFCYFQFYNNFFVFSLFYELFCVLS